MSFRMVVKHFHGLCSDGSLALVIIICYAILFLKPRLLQYVLMQHRTIELVWIIYVGTNLEQATEKRSRRCLWDHDTMTCWAELKRTESLAEINVILFLQVLHDPKTSISTHWGPSFVQLANAHTATCPIGENITWMPVCIEDNWTSWFLPLNNGFMVSRELSLRK